MVKMLKRVSVFVLSLALVLTFAVTVVNAQNPSWGGEYYTSGGASGGDTYGVYMVGIGGSNSTYDAPFAYITSAHKADLKITDLSIIYNGQVVSFPNQISNDSNYSNYLRWEKGYRPRTVTYIQCNFSNTSHLYGVWYGAARFPS
ncbi:hypothetical protein [Acetivibrio saccincola]|uniref:Uncharacterized protein n=1 Tax=Acetivibrio saccincola TaxID=1677857 RepID=A0A2K9EP21_9FIRM|nr:hypothetical protein [Acetivibrio saccincola]AUG58371.1 hypothetical protein HVS_12490 [Acetivibrio saccincola]